MSVATVAVAKAWFDVTRLKSEADAAEAVAAEVEALCDRIASASAAASAKVKALCDRIASASAAASAEAVALRAAATDAELAALSAEGVDFDDSDEGF